MNHAERLLANATAYTGATAIVSPYRRVVLSGHRAPADMQEMAAKAASEGRVYVYHDGPVGDCYGPYWSDVSEEMWVESTLSLLTPEERSLCEQRSTEDAARREADADEGRRIEGEIHVYLDSIYDPAQHGEYICDRDDFCRARMVELRQRWPDEMHYRNVRIPYAHDAARRWASGWAHRTTLT